MPVRIITPENGEHVSLSVNTPFLLAGTVVLASDDCASLHLSAGHVSTGGGTLHLHFDNTDYACEMVKAVTDAVESVNERWGLPRSSLDNSITGMNAPVNPETGKDNV